MPVIIRVTLSSGRYHAHLWGQAQHAMSGPEWPPSPWRLLRTIAACWFEATEPPCSRQERDDILNALGQADAPSIWVPKASFSELPYYQPLTKEVQRNVEGRKIAVREVNSRVLHYDHFVVVAAPDVYFGFDVDLKDKQRLVLSKLLSRARYFGRAESRASLDLAEPGQQKPDGHYEARPLGGERYQGDAIRRRVLVTTREFLAGDLWQVRQSSVRKTKARAKSTHDPSGIAEFPPHFVEALIAARKPAPDGTRWLEYVLPCAAVVHELPRRSATRKPSKQRPAAEVVFRLFRRVPIPVLDTVLLARDFRDQAVRSYERATGHQCVLLSGREEDGSVARGDRHAYYLPQPTQLSCGFLERFVVRLPGGENGVEQDVLDALLGVTRLFTRDTYPVLVVSEEVRSSPTVSTAARWRSLTPFLAPLRRRAHREGADPMRQILRPLHVVAVVSPNLTYGRKTRVVPVFSHLYRKGRLAGRRHYRFTRRAAVTFELEFAEAVTLPLSMGADAHFGLGQLSPSNEGADTAF